MYCMTVPIHMREMWPESPINKRSTMVVAKLKKQQIWKWILSPTSEPLVTSSCHFQNYPLSVAETNLLLSFEVMWQSSGDCKSEGLNRHQIFKYYQLQGQSPGPGPKKKNSSWIYAMLEFEYSHGLIKVTRPFSANQRPRIPAERKST